MRGLDSRSLGATPVADCLSTGLRSRPRGGAAGLSSRVTRRIARRGVALLLAILLSSPALLRAAAPTTRPTLPSSRPAALAAGNHTCTLEVDGRTRSYLVHVPARYDRGKPTPVVLVFHGAFTNATVTTVLTGLNAKADSAGFIAVYPNGTGVGNGALFFNAWSKSAPNGPPDDVAFTASLLDQLALQVNVDPKRVFATGISNGGMMCYRLAGELSERIAAIASVSGTLTLPEYHPKRAVPVLHFHGTADTIVPFAGPKGKASKTFVMKSVDETIKTWVALDGCAKQPATTTLPDTAHDGTTVTRDVYSGGKDGSEVVLYTITGGGHNWPGRIMPLKFLGKSTMNISANDLIWDFFCKHPMK